MEKEERKIVNIITPQLGDETVGYAITAPYHPEELLEEKNNFLDDSSEKSNNKDKSERGKKSRAKGQKFEIKVREDLEKKGWIVSKWVNTVDYEKNKVVSAKRKYNPFSKILTIGTGFPDFVCFKRVDKKNEEETIEGTSIPEEYLKKDDKEVFEVIGLEVKSNGYLDQIEKGMCIWLLENKIFSRILIAKKGKNRDDNGIEYVDFNKKYEKDAK